MSERKGKMEVSNLTQQHFCMELTDDTGKGLTEVFQVFPGIYLMYNDFHIEHCQSSYAPEGDFWGIEYCHSGNTEWKLENGDYAYLGAQTLMSCDYQECGENFSFPGRLFEGLTLGFEMPLAEKSLPEELGVGLFQLKDKISAAALINIAGKAELEAGLRLLYAARNQTDLHRKLSVAHFLVYLADLEPDLLEPIYMGKQAAEKIKEIENFLRDNLDHRWTLREISIRFQIPVSVFRRNFEKVFGVTMADHMRRIRTERAKEMLLNTRASIGETAAELGYDNASKFSEAFRIYENLSPSMYRKNSHGN